MVRNYRRVIPVYALHNNYPRATDNVHRRPLISARARPFQRKRAKLLPVSFLYRLSIRFVENDFTRFHYSNTLSLVLGFGVSTLVRNGEIILFWMSSGKSACPSVQQIHLRFDTNQVQNANWTFIDDKKLAGKKKTKRQKRSRWQRENPASFRVNDRVRINYPVVDRACARAFLRDQRRPFVVDPQFTETNPGTFDRRGNGCQRSIKLNRKEEKKRINRLPVTLAFRSTR